MKGMYYKSRVGDFVTVYFKSAILTWG